MENLRRKGFRFFKLNGNRLALCRTIEKEREREGKSEEEGERGRGKLETSFSRGMGMCALKLLQNTVFQLNILVDILLREDICVYQLVFQVDL